MKSEFWIVIWTGLMFIDWLLAQLIAWWMPRWVTVLIFVVSGLAVILWLMSLPLMDSSIERRMLHRR